MSNREVRELLKTMRERGWEFVRKCGSGHTLMRWPMNGLYTTVSNSPSDHRWLENKWSDIRKTEAKNVDNGSLSVGSKSAGLSSRQ